MGIVRALLGKWSYFLSAALLPTLLISCGPKITDRAGLLQAKGGQGEMASFVDAIGTQTIGARYQFSDESVLVETAKAILGMGSRLIKASLGEMTPEDFDTLLDMPFHTYIFWFQGGVRWIDGLTNDEKAAVYRETYDLASKLKTQYNGTGKTFYLGHWEGDWLLLQGYDVQKNPSPTEIQGMVDWLNTRQQAIDDVNKANAASDVKIFHYTEVNRVLDAMDRHQARVVNAVLPKTKVDYVSYSSYDIQGRPQADVSRVLDYIQAKLSPKEHITGKRVIVTEFGFSADAFRYNQVDHEKINREIMVKYLTWGVPIILYWEMYNNEVVQGRHRGFWLIDEKNVKWPLYFTMRDAYAAGHRYVEETQQSDGRLPTQSQYLSWLREYLIRGHYQEATL